MRSLTRVIWPLLMLMLLTACSTTKFVPQDQLLLRKMHVTINDRKQVQQTHREKQTPLDADELADKMKNYVRQRNNSEVFGFWPLQLQLYSLAGTDSTKWINQQLWKMGEAPEIFKPELADISRTEIQKAMFNKGYFNAQVDTAMRIKNQRLRLTYKVTAGDPYIIRSYTVRIDQPELKSIAKNEKTTLVHEGELFDASVLDDERERITRVMRRRGYYYFEKDYLQYQADSAFGKNEVMLSLQLPDYVANAPDSMKQQLFTRFIIRNVRFFSDFDLSQRPDSLNFTTETLGNYSFSYSGRRLIRSAVLQRNCAIIPGHYYNIAQVERTYSALNALGPIRFVDISFQQVGADSLDCNIVLTRGKLNTISAEIEGTYSAGDWGIAGGVGYANRNLFRGAEELNINASGSYEWRKMGGRAIVAQADAAIQFTNAPKVAIAYKYHNLPDEFKRTIANASLSYNLKPFGKRTTHTFKFFELSYVYLPWMSDRFRQQFLQPNNPLRYSYEDHFILDWSYAGAFTNYSKRQPFRSYATFSYQLETAGNLLYGLSHLFKQTPDTEDGSYRIFNIRYAQYVKGDFNFAYHQIFSPKHRIVYHAALGLAVPFGNANSMPYEKRYYAGGANSVRGWSAYGLGPGAYKGTGTTNDYYTQVGDIKLDLNLEYRWKVWSIFELAAFTDAGNVWTIREYDAQPHGVFKWNEFYKQIAWSYGVGLRLDFSFFVFRIDYGIRLYDPSRLFTDGLVWRTAPNGLGWNDMAFHFAIGHPF